MDESNDLPDLTPMIDIVFLLIVFFMTVANLQVRELVPIEVPIAENAVVPEERGTRITITLGEDGGLWFGPHPIALEELADYVARNKAASPGLKINLRADAKVAFKEVRKVFEASAEGGVPNIVFATYQSDK